MICTKLPETKDEIITQLEKNGVSGLRATAQFFTAVGKQGCWNEQKVDREYMMKIRPSIIEILDEMKAQE